MSQELLLVPGDLILASSDSAGDSAGWSSGCVMAHSQVGGWSASRQGLFPLNICWLPDTSFYTSLTGHQERPGRPVEKFGQVVQGLEAQLEDELELRVGQVVKITHIIDKDWYRYNTVLRLLLFSGE